MQLIGDEDEPNVRATTLALSDGLRARSINRWPSLRFDVGALNDVLSPLFPAGFYYKTFMGGTGWDLYGRLVRHVAGLGHAPVRASSLSPVTTWVSSSSRRAAPPSPPGTKRGAR